jgi:hypothetical protein
VGDRHQSRSVRCKNERVSRAYAVHYLVLTRAPTRPEPRPAPLPEADVASHVTGLVFRPALREGRAVRSTVLVSCQAS